MVTTLIWEKDTVLGETISVDDRLAVTTASDAHTLSNSERGLWFTWCWGVLTVEMMNWKLEQLGAVYLAVTILYRTATQHSLPSN